ncbi:MAG: NAD(P)/FAD-dependent oxidoreductase [Scytonematopsis contorta HA4267-MV1]|jgi:flavin-dependent dehydrogenase|nr:NAD(P)/FAD-dependent oxidoreductase [Scytonematopsis contorta HA4267-MV1]
MNYNHSLPQLTEVIILGGGPGGASTALTLGARGFPSIVLEVASAAKTKIGEIISPSFTPLLRKMGLEKLINTSAHLPSYGNRFVWGNSEPADRLFINHSNGNGWHLNRTDFEQKLSQLVTDRGNKWFWNCQFLEAHYNNTEWQILLKYQGKKQLIKANFLVDATGRVAKLAHYIGEKRKYYDQLTGLACYFSLEETGHISHFTNVEAVPDGWWYAAPLPDNRLVTVFMTDADLIDKSMHKTEGYWQKLQETQLIKALFPTSSLLNSEKSIRSQPAQTSSLVSPVGEGWLAVGDSAFAYDPISSYGIGSALGSGYYAGNAIADYLRGCKESLLAYRMVTERAFFQYLHMLRYQYLQEQRWTDSRFWNRRHQEEFGN